MSPGVTKGAHLSLSMECEVKWALGSITTNKANGGDEIPVELFQILKEEPTGGRLQTL